MGVGKKLQQLIALRNRNVNDIAQAINISSSTLYSIIRRDNNKVDIDVLQDIANELDVTLDYFTSDNNQSTADLSPSEQSLIKKYRLLSAKEQAVVDNLIDGLAPTSSDNTVKTNPNSEIIEKLGVDPTPENGFISHKDMVGKGIAAFGGNKKKTKF